MFKEVDFSLVNMAMVRAQNEEKGDPPSQFFIFFKIFLYVPNYKTPSPKEGFHPSRIFFFSVFFSKLWIFLNFFFLKIFFS